MAHGLGINLRDAIKENSLDGWRAHAFARVCSPYTSIIVCSWSERPPMTTSSSRVLPAASGLGEPRRRVSESAGFTWPSASSIDSRESRRRIPTTSWPAKSDGASSSAALSAPCDVRVAVAFSPRLESRSASSIVALWSASCGGMAIVIQQVSLTLIACHSRDNLLDIENIGASIARLAHESH